MDSSRTPSPQGNSNSDYSNIQSISPPPPFGMSPLTALENMVESISDPGSTEEDPVDPTPLPVAYPLTPGFSSFSLGTLFDCESEKPVESSTSSKVVENSSSSSLVLQTLPRTRHVLMKIVRKPEVQLPNPYIMKM